ncbi:uncharacterized protein isoform X1 [Danio rerio]|uniref:Si:dkey-58f10.11 n=1 Tax=Danio rerio TaxID=7955 RepID=A0A8N7UYZ6_DANRE|nr:uncharacterized protein LOC100003654 [Danio rerio]XP_005165313.1 uncharacterized protein LOC100003654 isoform X1 [Danio rerio]|eukprot:NP_001119947.1 uncharacterized protein LOC100003654 [Danio rerio]
MDKFIGDFQRRLHKEVYGLREVSILDHCGFILYFCLITSRAGTDIDAAIRNLMLVQADKQVIIAVLYPTIDPEKTIPDSNNAIKKENTYLVDFLFNEDEGFMNCQKNKDAINKLARYIKSMNLTSYYLQNYGIPRTYLYQNRDFPVTIGGHRIRKKCFFYFGVFLILIICLIYLLVIQGYHGKTNYLNKDRNDTVKHDYSF